MSGDAREAFRARLEGVLAERYHDRRCRFSSSVVDSRTTTPFSIK